MNNSSLQPETFISVDVETSGPTPGRYSLLAIGACLVAEPGQTFYVELHPLNNLSLEELKKHGLPPEKAMAQFEAWLEELMPTGSRPVFVAFNAPFDWMFINEYFHRFLGRNPFGHNGLDIKAFFMGLTGCAWSETSFKHITSHYIGERALSHNARQDAVDQAETFRRMLAEARARAGV